MRITRCDNHPDREAVVTLSIRKLPPGARPLIFGYGAPPQQCIDLCKKCKDLIFPSIKEKIDETDA